jgi:hypothetical protein
MTSRTVGRATVAAFVGAGLLVGGCGGASGEPAASAGSIKEKAASSSIQKPARRAKRHARGGKRKHASRGDGRPASRGKARRRRPGKSGEAGSRPQNLGDAVGQAVGRLPAGKREQLVGSVVRTTFRAFGLRPPQVTVTQSGAAVQAGVSASDACTSPPGIEGRVGAAIREAVPIVTSVRIIVSGTGQSLAGYARGQCSGNGLPAGGRGPVVLTLRGSGYVDTRSFTVRSRRWTIEFVNGGQSLGIFPLKGETPTAGAFSTSKPSGRHVMRGAGRFTLRITGTSAWVIRVRDGS